MSFVHTTTPYKQQTQKQRSRSSFVPFFLFLFLSLFGSIGRVSSFFSFLIGTSCDQVGKRRDAFIGCKSCRSLLGLINNKKKKFRRQRWWWQGPQSWIHGAFILDHRRERQSERLRYSGGGKRNNRPGVNSGQISITYWLWKRVPQKYPLTPHDTHLSA